MEYKVRLLPQFKQELDMATDYIAFALKNAPAANAMLDDLDRAIEIIAAYPYSFPPYFTESVGGEEYRAVSVKNYLAFYVVMEGTVEFRRFLYARSRLTP